MRLGWYSLAFATALLLLSSEARGWSCGRWDLPSTPAQYFGYGYGPGHHVPMLRMPCCQPPQVPRIAVTCNCPQARCSSCGTRNCGSTMYRELESPADAIPTPAPQSRTAPSQTRHLQPSLFLR